MNWLQKTAMFVSGEGDHLIAYKSYIFLIDPMKQDVDDPIVRQMANFLGTPTRELVSKYSDTWEYLSSLRVRPDILQGTLSDDRHTLTLQSDNFQHGSGSRLLQNVMKTLNIGDVQYQNEEEVYRNMSDWQVTGDLPEFMFHGTSSESADRILRFGLQSGESVTNYPGRGPHHDISHDDIVFLAEDVNRAMYHALTAAGNQNGFPVIFRFKIPDPNLLVPDYDVEVMYDDEFEGNIYQNTYKAPRDKFDTGINEEPYGFSKKIGVMGYRGRIPANFIVDIMIRPEGDLYNYSGDEWISVTAAQLNTAIEIGDPTMYDYEAEEEFEEEFEDPNIYATNNWLLNTAQKPMSLPYAVPDLPRDEFNIPQYPDRGMGMINERMSEPTALREKERYPNMEYFNAGYEGLVSRVSSGILAKYTYHKDEAQTALEAYTYKFPFIVPILESPRQIQSGGNPLWIIIMKEVQPLSQNEGYVTGYLDLQRRPKMPSLEDTVQQLNFDKIPVDMDTIIKVYKAYKIFAFSLQKEGYSLADAHGGNLGWHEGRIVLFDLGGAS